MQPTFVHLHLHSEFSLSDSTLRITSLVKRCAQFGMPALALTDQSNLFALVKFYKAAEKAGIKPIAGADVWIEEAGRKPARLTLLCQNALGYQHLSELVSQAYLDGHRGDYVVLLPEWLQARHEGLIVLAGRESDIGQSLAAGNEEDAGMRLAQWQAIFRDRFYLELTRTARQGEAQFEHGALKLAKMLHCPVVASNDVRFLDREDFDAHEARVCIATGKRLGDPKRPREYTPEQYLKSPQEMAALFADLPGALENTVEIARRCTLEISFGKDKNEYLLPSFPVPENHDEGSFIREQSREGLKTRLEGVALRNGLTREDYEQRLERELDVIVGMGFSGYFLIVADFINWAKRNDIPVGPGRGSGAGSLVAWCLRITDVDPLPYNLLFERFLNPERVSMPDFDIDFCMDKRDRVIDYVAQKYGRDRVSQIITYGTMAAKAVVRDTGRVLDMPYGQVDGVAKLIPMTLGIGLEDALGRSAEQETDPAKKEEKQKLAAPELIERYNTDEEVKALIDLALKLEDLARNASKHAGGVVIGPRPLAEISPLYAEAPNKLDTHRSVVTQFDKDDVETIGLVKFDFLGLRTLTIIDWAMKAINARLASEGKPAKDIATIPLDDANVFRGVFANGNTGSVFQFESDGMRRALKVAKPDRFEDLIALNALYRPGPMEMISSFAARKHGTEQFQYPDARTEAMLKETYGIMVYQEQVMQMAQIVGGYSLGGADLLRRAMGKKVPAEMARHRSIFREGAAKNGVDEVKADEIFDLMEKFAGYGFNKSHAAAYALIAYQTAWLKTYYPAEFMAAVLSSDMDRTDKVVGFLDECRALQVTVLPPHVNASEFMFVATDPRTIRYGLGAIKGVGENASLEIARLRKEDGDYRDQFDFARRLGQKVNKHVHEVLIRAGALDGLGQNRATMDAHLPDVLHATEQLARDRAAGQFDIFGMAVAEDAPPIPAPPPLPEWELLDRLKAERETLGHYLSGHPIDPLRELLEPIIVCSLDKIAEAWEQRRYLKGNESLVLIAGQVGACRKLEERAFLTLEDGRGTMEVSLFNEACREYAALLKTGAFLLIEGQLQEDRFRGGISMRVKRVWEMDDYCAQYAQPVRLVFDATLENANVVALEAALAQFRPGPTAVKIALHTAAARGEIELHERQYVRAVPALLQALRAVPGITEARFALSRAALPVGRNDRDRDSAMFEIA